MYTVTTCDNNLSANIIITGFHIPILKRYRKYFQYLHSRRKYLATKKNYPLPALSFQLHHKMWVVQTHDISLTILRILQQLRNADPVQLQLRKVATIQNKQKIITRTSVKKIHLGAINSEVSDPDIHKTDYPTTQSLKTWALLCQITEILSCRYEI